MREIFECKFIRPVGKKEAVGKYGAVGEYLIHECTGEIFIGFTILIYEAKIIEKHTFCSVILKK